MDPSNLQKQNEPEQPRFLDFPHLPDHSTQDGKLRLNRYSSTITKDHDFPGAQVNRPLMFAGKSVKLTLTRPCCTRPACRTGRL